MVRNAALREVAIAASEALSLGADVVPLLGDRDTHTRYFAAAALEKIGDCRPEVIDALAPVTKDVSRDVRRNALDALAACGPREGTAIAPAAAALHDPDLEVRRSAIGAMKAFGPLGYREWQQVLTIGRTEPRLREAALDAIAEMTGNAAQFYRNKDLPDQYRYLQVPNDVQVAASAAVAGFLRDPDPSVREAALRALDLMRVTKLDGEEVVGGLLAAARDTQEDVRYYAIPLLARLASPDDDVSPAATEAAQERLLVLIRDDVALIRLEALTEMGSSMETPEAGEAIAAMLDDPSHRVRNKAVEVLGEHHAVDGSTPAPLLPLLDDPVDDVRGTAAYALSKFENGALDEAVDALAKASAREKNVMVRRSIADSLGTLCQADGKAHIDRRGAACATAADAVYRLLVDRDEWVRNSAAAALESLAPYAALRPEILKTALRDPSATVRSRIVSAVASYGTELAAWTPELIALLRDGSAEVRNAAASALVLVAPDVPATIDPLKAALTDESKKVRTRAAEALGRYRERAEPAIPALLAAVEDSRTVPDEYVDAAQYHRILGEAIGRIGPRALKALEERLAQAEAKAAAPPESAPATMAAAMFGRYTGNRDFRTVAEAAKKVSGTTTYAASTSAGAATTITVARDAPLIALASWCPVSRELDGILKHPLMQPYLRSTEIHYLFEDETADIRKGLQEVIAGDPSDRRDPEAVINALPTTTGGVRLFDMEFFDRSRAQSFFVGTGSKSARAFPYLLNIETDEFDTYWDDWLSRLPIPPRILSIARHDAKAEFEQRFGTGEEE